MKVLDCLLWRDWWEPFAEPRVLALGQRSTNEMRAVIDGWAASAPMAWLGLGGCHPSASTEMLSSGI